jgi:predicted dehydrogenase
MTRRSFVKRSLEIGGGLALLGAAGARAAPSERTTIGFIGAGGIANAHLGPLLAQPDVQIVAICDVNGQRREAMVKAVDTHYGAGGCKGYNDFRELLARPDVDAVLIATPDNWHGLQTIAAARAGKHIYSEKPFARTVAEGRAMCEAIRRHGIVFQHGTQQRSDGMFRFACELVRNGRIGKLHTVRVAVCGGRQAGPGTPGPVPEWFDYDLWLGPAPWAPYSPERIENLHWFFMEDYSAGGYISGWGIHHVDIAQWGMGTELTGPVQIEGTATFPEAGLCDTPITWHVEYDFGGAPRVIFTTTNEAPFGITFEGSEGTVFVNRGEFKTKPESLAKEAIGPGEVHLYKSDNHHRNWLECIRTGAGTAAPPEIGHRSQTICCLADIAIRLGRKLKWDAKAERVIGDDTANRMLSRVMREPWSL